MNLDQMPCGATAAELAYDRQGEKLEAELKRMQALYPLESFEPQAWSAAIDNNELLHYLVAEAPTTVLYLLLNRTGSTPDWLDVNAPDCEHLISRLIKIWIEDQQERLQENAVEKAR